MAGEIRKEEEMFENEQNAKTVVNPEISNIERDLEKLHSEGKLNELNMYLYGLVLKEQQRNKEAKDVFIAVLNIFPCFWSVWLELCRII